MQNPKLVMNVSDIIKNGQKMKVDISKITVPDYHDRTDVDDDNIESLANNMSEVGQLNPILVDRKSDDHFELISGLRRYDAALKINWSEIDAIVFDELDEQGRMLIMIAENAQRQDLNDYDLISSLIHFMAASTGKTDDEIKSFLFKLKNHDSGNVKSFSFEEKQLKKSLDNCIEKTDKYSLNFVINKLKILNFSPAIIKAMKEHKLLYTYGVMLNKVKDEQIINELLTKFLNKQLTKDDLKKEIKKITASDAPFVVPFNGTLKKLKDFSKLPSEKQSAISEKMQEIEDLLAS